MLPFACGQGGITAAALDSASSAVVSETVCSEQGDEMKADELKEDKKVALVAILGVTPAVLTEAVWALAHQGCPVVPDDILVLTTGTTGQEESGRADSDRQEKRHLGVA